MIRGEAWNGTIDKAAVNPVSLMANGSVEILEQAERLECRVW